MKIEKSITKHKLENLLQVQGMYSRIIIGFKNNTSSDFLQKKSLDIENLVRLMIKNLGLFIKKKQNLTTYPHLLSYWKLELK